MEEAQALIHITNLIEEKGVDKWYQYQHHHGHARFGRFPFTER